MPISQRLARKLHETLGAESAEEFVSWMGEIDTHRADVLQLRHEMQLSFTRLETKVEAKIDQTRSALEAALEKRTSELMKWSFVFWVGAVSAIAALAGVLRN